jgi:chromate transport protein ChrA
MPLLRSHDNTADRRNALLVFYIAALLSAGTIGVAGKIPSFRPLLFALAIASAGVAFVFLLRFLRANDEREQQINYRALTFAFTGTLIFSLTIGFLQSFGFHPVSWLGIPVLMIILWSAGLILYSWRYR